MKDEELDLETIEDEEYEEYEEYEGDEEDESDEGEAEAGSDDEDEPEDLADAFSRVVAMDSNNADSDVEDAGAGEGVPAEGEDGEGDGDEEDADDDSSLDYSGDEDDRGYAEPYPTADYQASQQAIIDRLNSDAVSKARKQFRDEGIREFTMNDIYQRTQDGRVVYRNPDDPNRPFASRMEAQQWIDSFNKQVNEELIKVATEIRDKNAKAAMPAIRLLQFAPRYDAMDQKVKEVFDDLIEDYELKNRSGKVVGYGCDLDKMAAKAERLASKYNHTSHKRGGSGKVRKTEARRSPALDARSHGSSSDKGGDDGEPKTMEEAFKRLRQQTNGGK